MRRWGLPEHYGAIGTYLPTQIAGNERGHAPDRGRRLTSGWVTSGVLSLLATTGRFVMATDTAPCPGRDRERATKGFGAPRGSTCV